MNKIVVLAAHPDDEILGCGGVISKFISLGSAVKVVFIGEGSTCRYKSVEADEALRAIKKRNDSALSALNFLGVKEYSFHNFPCGRFDQIPIIEINKIIESEIRDFDPTTVFTHSEVDANSDHCIVFRSTLMATRPVIKSQLSTVLSYEVPSSTEWSFTRSFCPNYYIELTEENINNKISALQLYETEVKPYPFPRSPEGVKAFSMMRGMQSATTFAEAFQLVRSFRR